MTFLTGYRDWSDTEDKCQIYIFGSEKKENDLVVVEPIKIY